nr:hypothetical protein HmN_000881300 [Hymenolepis microstoma]
MRHTFGQEPLGSRLGVLQRGQGGGGRLPAFRTARWYSPPPFLPTYDSSPSTFNQHTLRTSYHPAYNDVYSASVTSTMWSPPHPNHCVAHSHPHTPYHQTSSVYWYNNTTTYSNSRATTDHDTGMREEE